VRWSDGTSLTASDVAFTFNLMKNNAALNTGGIPLAGVTAPNATTVAMTFVTPSYSYISPILTTKPVPKHIWEHQKNPVTFADPHPVGSGPYVLRNFTPQAITLAKNPKFWQAGKVKVETMRYLAFDSPASVQAALESGQIDLEDHVFPDFKKLIARPGLGGLLINSGTVQLLLNVTRYPLNILAVRQAISDALDRPAITQRGLGGLQAPETSQTGLPPALARDIAPADKHLTYGAADPAKAKAALVKAGFKLGANGIFRTPKGTPLNLTMILGTAQGNLQSAAQVMKGQLSAAGIGLSIQTEQYPAVHSAVLQGKFDLNILADQVFSSYDFYRMMLDTREYKPVGQRAAYDLGRFQDPAAAAAYKTWAMSKPGSSAATRARDQIEKIMVDEVPSVPLFSSSPQGAYNTQRFTGWPTKANPYGLPEVTGDDAELLMLHVRPR
jgi:peptide/nickel transport system substrate-binding protein